MRYRLMGMNVWFGVESSIQVSFNYLIYSG